VQSNSFQYIIFLFVVLLVMAATSRMKNARWIVLLVSSYFFYFTWQPFYLVLLMFITGVGYFCGRRIGQEPDQGKKRFWMRTGVFTILAILCFFKYYSAVNEAILSMMGVTGDPSALAGFRLLLPVGISFYTFQTLSYLFDVYNEVRTEEKHLGYFASYVGSFPQLLSGPIERSEKFIDQLRAPFIFNWNEVVLGLRRIALGIAKKMLVADRLGMLIDPIYSDPSKADGGTLLFAATLYIFQIYYDFSSYTDIAIGSARVLRINLSENFNFPYFSKNITEYWRKWHMTLANWLRDYVYNPIVLSGRKWGNAIVYVALFVTFIICGLWHGAHWNFVIFGALQGIVLIAEAMLAKKRKKAAKSKWRPLYMAVSWVLTFSFIIFCDIFIRVHSTEDAMLVIGKIFSGIPHRAELMVYIGSQNLYRVAFTLLLFGTMLVTEKWLTRLSKGEITKGPVVNMLVYAFMIAAVLMWGFWGKVNFVYFQF